MEQAVAVNLNTEKTLEVSLPEEVSCGNFEVIWGQSAEFQVETALTYIKSGEEEIKNFVNDVVLPPLTNYVEQARESANNALADAENAKESAELAYESEQKAKQSEEKAFQEANASAESAYQSQQSALAAYEYASNADEDAKNALETLGHVLESEERARIWADGDDVEVQPLGGTHSSMVSAGLSYAYANAPEDTPVEEWATTHDLIVQGEKGDKGETGEKGQPFKYEDFTQEQLDSLMFFEAGNNLEFVQGGNKKILNAIVPDVSGFATKTELNNKQDKGNYALKSEIPTKVSAFQNDKGYLTQHQDISHLATKNYVDTTEQEIIKNFMDSDTALQTQITGLSNALENAQDDIVGINGKIPATASSSNLLVTSTELFNAGQNIRADFAEADSELQTQINGQAQAITQLDDDVMSNMSEVADLKTSKADKETVSILNSTTTISNNTIFRGGEMATLELLVPSSLNNTFICEVDFTSGATATAFTMVDTVKWRGDDITDGSFVPVANKRYGVLVWFDGTFVRAESEGVEL